MLLTPMRISKGFLNASLSKVPNTMKKLNSFLNHTLLPQLDLKADLDESGTLEAVKRNIEFKGASLWSLIFAMLIASIGLNVNSTAVIIGAMLISPLMGPIVGAGVSLGVNDFDLFKKSIKSLARASCFGIGASTLYFLISPLSAAQSELLARTQPTIYDVLIAICGGATGIIASSRKEKNFNAISGVAIATALMPPLCTIGYGISRGEPRYFVGALYLFLINAVFICLASFAFVKLLRFKRRVYLDIKIEKKVTQIITLIIFLILLPSIYTSYKMLDELVFQTEANRFISNNFKFSETKIIETKLVSTEGIRSIDITLIGRPLTSDEETALHALMNTSKLRGTTLNIHHLKTQQQIPSN